MQNYDTDSSDSTSCCCCKKQKLVCQLLALGNVAVVTPMEDIDAVPEDRLVVINDVPVPCNQIIVWKKRGPIEIELDEIVATEPSAKRIKSVVKMVNLNYDVPNPDPIEVNQDATFTNNTTTITTPVINNEASQRVNIRLDENDYDEIKNQTNTKRFLLFEFNEAAEFDDDCKKQSLIEIKIQDDPPFAIIGNKDFSVAHNAIAEIVPPADGNTNRRTTSCELSIWDQTFTRFNPIDCFLTITDPTLQARVTGCWAYANASSPVTNALRFESFYFETVLPAGGKMIYQFNATPGEVIEVYHKNFVNFPNGVTDDCYARQTATFASELGRHRTDIVGVTNSTSVPMQTPVVVNMQTADQIFTLYTYTHYPTREDYWCPNRIWAGNTQIVLSNDVEQNVTLDASCSKTFTPLFAQNSNETTYDIVTRTFNEDGFELNTEYLLVKFIKPTFTYRDVTNRNMNIAWITGLTCYPNANDTNKNSFTFNSSESGLSTLQIKRVTSDPVATGRTYAYYNPSSQLPFIITLTLTRNLNLLGLNWNAATSIDTTINGVTTTTSVAVDQTTVTLDISANSGVLPEMNQIEFTPTLNVGEAIQIDSITVTLPQQTNIEWITALSAFTGLIDTSDPPDNRYFVNSTYVANQNNLGKAQFNISRNNTFGPITAVTNGGVTLRKNDLSTTIQWTDTAGTARATMYDLDSAIDVSTTNASFTAYKAPGGQGQIVGFIQYKDLI